MLGESTGYSIPNRFALCRIGYVRGHRPTSLLSQSGIQFPVSPGSTTNRRDQNKYINCHVWTNYPVELPKIKIKNKNRNKTLTRMF